MCFGMRFGPVDVLLNAFGADAALACTVYATSLEDKNDWSSSRCGRHAVRFGAVDVHYHHVHDHRGVAGVNDRAACLP